MELVCLISSMSSLILSCYQLEQKEYGWSLFNFGLFLVLAGALVRFMNV